MLDDWRECSECGLTHVHMRHPPFHFHTKNCRICMSHIYCSPCFNEDIHDHPKGDCPNFWLDSQCDCNKGEQVGNHDQFGLNDELLQARKDRVNWTNVDVKKEPSIGIDPDYDNKIPEPKALTVPELVTLLNKEYFGDKKWRVYSEEYWEWGGDYLSHWPSGFRLQFDRKDVGILQGNWEPLYDKFDSIILLGEATLGQARFLKECTGWKIEI